MRKVQWVDENGWKHVSWLKDNEPDSKAPEGLSHDPPDINRIHWDEIKKEIHNRMVDMELNSWSEVVKHQNALTSIITGAVKRHLVFLFREGEKSHE